MVFNERHFAMMIMIKLLGAAVILLFLSLVLSDVPKLYREHCKEKGKAPAKHYMVWCMVYIWIMCLLPGGMTWSNTTNFWAGFAAFVFCGGFSTFFALKEAKWAKLRAQKNSAEKEKIK